VSSKVSEIGICLHCFADAAFSGKSAFPMCGHSVRRDWQVHFKKLFMYGDTTSCMSLAVSDSGAELVLGF